MNRSDGVHRLARCFTLRMNVFLFVLVITALLTVIRPAFLIVWFKSSPVEMLSRLWVIASLITTIIISFFANKEVVSVNYQAGMGDEEWGERIGQASGWNSLILIYCCIVIFLTIMPGFPLLAVYMMSGMGLVCMISRFDWLILGMAESRLSAAKSREARTSTPALEAEEDQNTSPTELDKARADYEVGDETFFKLDIPIFVGVIITFVVGQLLLPHVMLPTDATGDVVRIYANGFASGATAIQIIIGNVTFAIIAALTGR